MSNGGKTAWQPARESANFAEGDCTNFAQRISSAFLQFWAERRLVHGKGFPEEESRPDCRGIHAYVPEDGGARSDHRPRRWREPTNEREDRTAAAVHHHLGTWTSSCNWIMRLGIPGLRLFLRLVVGMFISLRGYPNLLVCELAGQTKC